MFGCTLVTTALQIALLLLVYRMETPKYFLQNGKEEECRKVLEYIYKPEYVDEVLAEKKRDLGLETSEGSRVKGSGSVITQSASGSEVDENKEALLQKNGAKFNKLRLILGIHLALLQQFVGINVVVGYGTDIASNIFPQMKNVIPVFLNF